MQRATVETVSKPSAPDKIFVRDECLIPATDLHQHYHFQGCPAKPSGDVVSYCLHSAFPSLTALSQTVGNREQPTDANTSYSN